MKIVWHKTPAEMNRLYPKASVKEMAEHGCWGFTDMDSETVHLWRSPNCPLEKMIEVVGHELGHLTGEPCDDMDEEEFRAGEYGEVAMNAYRIAMESEQDQDE